MSYPRQDLEHESHESYVRRQPVTAYFALTFMISWLGALAFAAPHLVRHEPFPKLTGILMFPAMLLGPSLTGILLTRIVEGKTGLRDLISRLGRMRFPMRWYAALLIPPVLVLTVLRLLTKFVAPVFAPNFFLVGIMFGVPAGFLEEIGWTGYAFPRMQSHRSWLAASVLLGLLWSAWHLPVINYLGTATPHHDYWLPFFLAFTFAMTAVRVLIGWLYIHTRSVLLAQLMHVSSTGSLVVFSAPRVTAGQEVLWYVLYGIALWTVTGILIRLPVKRTNKEAFPLLQDAQRGGRG